MNQSKISKLAQKLQKNSAITQKVGKLLSKIDDEIKKTPFKAIESLNKFIIPKKNIDLTIKFYKTILTTKDLFDSENIKLKENIKKINEKKYKTNNLRLEIETTNSIKAIQTGLEKLEEYSEIRIVKILVQDEQPHLDEALYSILLSFFKYLKRFVPKVSDDSKTLLNFLMNNMEKTEIFKEYSNVFYKLYGYDKLSKNELIERIKKLDDDLDEIKDINEFLLPENIKKLLNLELESNLIIKLKEKTMKMLVAIQKEENYNEIEFLGILYTNIYLVRNKLGDKELEKEILKLINNLLLTYFQEVEKLTKPNKNFHEEKVTKVCITIIKTFRDEEKLCKKFIKKYKHIFDVGTKDELILKITLDLYKKIHNLGSTLKDKENIQYLLNNIFYLQKEIKTIDDKDLVSESQQLMSDFLDIWKSEIISTKNEEKADFIRSKIENQSHFKVPSELREYIIEQIKKIVKKNFKGYKKEGFDFNHLFLS
ncbi:hypothetical protein SLOPH_1807 [Spraguea lophii 42_110]|uniref:Uncharacterized protein n=1 Tax=Spraguea lophii (strain 42_110) TaxID=1358809 RepID=S7W8G4_SPRLO|nr:hypothetical protein SLOPH_1807 [Spraguea lophii 42_110]